jgi:AcrR family transcriptional regulator
MPRDADATKKRLLDAAGAEFAAHGIAGARVDRIAAAANANKSLIYAYFGSKDGLFDAVFEAMVVGTVDEAPIDADDLPGFAGRIFDHRLKRPEVLRLVSWDRLERDSAGYDGKIVRDAQAKKVKAIAAAQKAGKVSTDLSAAALLEFIIALSQTELDLKPGSKSAAAHRARIVAAVERLVTP